ncbi:MAG: hypothetical protein EAZ34_10440 [Polaromonas sp.]|nr:MAG: hypothetical protein EAZ34_10440 [Polaromonas sp.]
MGVIFYQSNLHLRRELEPQRAADTRHRVKTRLRLPSPSVVTSNASTSNASNQQCQQSAGQVVAEKQLGHVPWPHFGEGRVVAAWL